MQQENTGQPVHEAQVTEPQGGRDGSALGVVGGPWGANLLADVALVGSGCFLASALLLPAVSEYGIKQDFISELAIGTAVTASLSTNFATGQGSDVFVGIEDLAGTAFGDTLEGSNSANVLEGLGGDDALKVRDGRDNDTANGGTGSDTCQRDPGDTVRSCP